MKFFSDFFASFDQQDSLIFLLFSLLSFLIGFVLSWFIAKRRDAQLRQETKKAQAEYKALNAEYQSFKEQFELREADLQRAQVEVEDSKRRIKNLLEEGKQETAELEETNAELIRLEAAVTSQQVTIEDLNDQILGLRTKNQQLIDDPDEVSVPEQLAVEETPFEVSDSPEDPPFEPVDTVAAMQSTFNAALQRLTSIEGKIKRLESENASLREHISETPAGRSMESSVEALFEIDEEEDEEANVLQARRHLNTAIGTVLPEANEEGKDDLKKIEGIGSFIEKQLNEVGLYTYEQISKLDEVLIEQLTSAIQFFPGRIVKDDWMGQAARLMANPVEEDKEDSTPAEKEAPQSLQVIEGIGPKIETLLVEAGIPSLADLANAEVAQLQEILSAAGERFRLHDPATWPDQARLATDGEWDQLKEFKEYLDGGKHPE